MLKFANAINDSNIEHISKVHLKQVEVKNYQLDIYHVGPILSEKFRANRHQKHLERALDGKLTLHFINTDA